MHEIQIFQDIHCHDAGHMASGVLTIKDPCLGACKVWLGAHTSIVRMLTDAFKPEEAKAALEALKENGIIDAVLKHNYSEKFFEDIVKVTSKLINDNKMPNILVLSSEILRIPRPQSDSLDTAAVGSRMDVMDKRMGGVEKNMSEILKNIQMIMAKNAVPPVLARKDNHDGQHVDPAGTLGRDAGQNGYAQAAAASGLSNTQRGPQSQFRSRLNSKRNHAEMENGAAANDVNESDEKANNQNWKDVKGRKQRKVTYGKAKVETSRSDVAVAPFEVFIANTHPKSTEELIKEILKDCSTADQSRTGPLEILEVKCMTNKEKIPNPRTLCWKITVPHREREYISKDESFPEGWAHRRFFPPRTQNVPLLKPTMPQQNKQPRMELDNTDNAGA